MKFRQMIRVFKHQNENRYLIKVMDFMSCGNTVRFGYKGSPVELLESFSTENPISDHQKILEKFKHCKCSRISEWYKFNPLQYLNLEYELSVLEGNPLKPTTQSLVVLAFGIFIISVAASSSLSLWTLNNNINYQQTFKDYSYRQLE